MSAPAADSPAIDRTRAVAAIRQLRGGVVAGVMEKASEADFAAFVTSLARSGFVADLATGDAHHPAHMAEGTALDPAALPPPKRKFGRKPDMAIDPWVPSDEQKRMLAFVDKSVRLVNREVIHKHIPGLTKERFVEFAAAVARLRADYLSCAMRAFLDGEGSEKELADLAHKRELFEEGVKAYEALHRALERGYIDPEGSKT
ncbi:MAG: hypothetical protein O9277_08260 [Magnetospirillum sp.]|nr:hypothetical protein [Magnetospirillum sp.]